jgi:hypothetical protein
MPALIPIRSFQCKKITLFLVVAFLSSPAAAQSPERHAPESYASDYFARFMPQNALDMILTLPGFTFQAGDESRRGLGDAGGNVLLDGERLAAKNGGLASALAAIPARQVARIEILRGAIAGQAQGYDVVANIVRLQAQRGIAAELQMAPIRSSMTGMAALTVTRDIGTFSLTARTAFDAPGERSHGRRVIMDTRGGTVRTDALHYRTNYPEVSERLTVAGPLSSGQLSFNAMIAYARLTEAFTFSGPSVYEAFPKDKRRWRGEAGLDWSLPIGRDYQLKLQTLGRQTRLSGSETGQAGPDEASFQNNDRFESDTTTSEVIASASLNHKGEARLRPESRIELSRNTLERSSIFTRFSADGAAASNLLDEAGVRESRIEVGGGLNWTPASRWTVTAGGAYETSWIRGDGSAKGRNRFAFLKPRLLVSWKPDSRNDLRVSLRRTVGQLSFDNFAASASLAEGISASGNARLGPDHRLSASLEYDHRFAARGALSLRAWHDWSRDVLELTVLESGAFGMTNVPRARLWGVTATLDLPTDEIIPGGLLKLRYSRFGSRLNDPLTGENRRVNSARVSDLGGSFRMNLWANSLSWGFDVTRGYTVGYWYADEVREQRHLWDTSVFVETNRFFNTRLRLQASGLTGAGNSFDRMLYSPDRAHLLSARERWTIRTPVIVTLAASRSF